MGAGMTLAKRRLMLNEPHLVSAQSDGILTLDTDMRAPLKTLRVDFEPVQEGEGDPSPENIRPITGWDGANVEARGKNLLDMLRPSYGKATDNRYYEELNANNRDINRITLIAGLTYTLSFDLVCDKYPCNVSVGCGNESFSQDIRMVQTDKNGRAVITFTPSEAQLKGRPYFAMRPVRYASPTTFTWSVTNIQLEIGSTATSYEPYSGSTTPISWADEAGTVYGGYLEWLRDGTVRVTATRVAVDPTKWTRYNKSNGFTAYQISNLPRTRYMREAENGCISNIISVFGSFSSSAMNRNIIQAPRPTQPSAYLALRDDLNPADVQLSYIIATPVTYTLTPQEVLRTLCGENNLWSDTNGPISATYWTH